MPDQIGQDDPASSLVDATGRSVRLAREDAKRCPRCGAGPEKRVASAGFGDPHPVCSRCGFEWLGERMEG